jgi:hypothetical protein
MNASQMYLTPSELVYLNGEQFAQKAGMLNKTRLIHMEYDVNTVQLAQAVIAAAFLTMEQQGTLRLQLRSKKVMLGLASSQTLYVDSVGPAAAWPQTTLEAALPGLAYNLAMENGKNEVVNAVYAWLSYDSVNPYDDVYFHIKNGLALRGLLEAHEERRLKIFTKTVYACNDATRQLIATQPVQPVQQLIAWNQQSRPDIWKELNEQIKKAISARQEKTDTDFDND